MLPKVLTGIVCFLSYVFLSAQNEAHKNDYQWLIGYQSSSATPESEGTLIDFHGGDGVTLFAEPLAVPFNISASTICDKDGNLVFSTNNFTVMNANNEVMLNGDSLNPNGWFNQDRAQQSQLALPIPESDSLYMLIHQEYTYVGNVDSLFLVPFTMYYSTIDLRFNTQSGFLGRIVDKNIPILYDTIMSGRLTATRHANGRDWWVLSKKLGTNKYYTYLVGPQGINEATVQYSGELPWQYGGIGQAAFSPDGSIYAQTICKDFSTTYHLDIFNFDRCSGALSPIQRIPLNVGNFPGGLAISRNSQYLYYTDIEGYYQVDLSKDSLYLELVEDRSDTTSFALQGQLGPDGKIYFAGGLGSTQHYHVIENPDAPADEVIVHQNGLELPHLNSGTIPHHPNYRLGRLIGSPCDTIYNTVSTTQIPPELPALELAPNPAQTQTRLVNLPARAALSVHDAQGRTVFQTQTTSYEMNLDVSSWVPGMYTVEVAGRRPQRLVVVR